MAVAIRVQYLARTAPGFAAKLYGDFANRGERPASAVVVELEQRARVHVVEQWRWLFRHDLALRFACTAAAALAD